MASQTVEDKVAQMEQAFADFNHEVDEGLWVKPTDAYQELGMSRSNVYYKLRPEDGWPHIRIGGHIWIPREVIDRLKAEQEGAEE